MAKKVYRDEESYDWRDDVVVKTSALQSVHWGSFPKSSHKTLNNGIHSFPAWRSA